MKRLILLTSFLISFLNVGVYNYTVEEVIDDTHAGEVIPLEDRQEAIVSLERNKQLVGMGVIFEIEEEEVYILTSYDITNKNRNLKVIYNNLEEQSVEIVGSSDKENISLIKAPINNKNNVSKMTYTSSYAIKEGQVATMLFLNEDRSVLMSRGVVSKKSALVQETYKTIVTTRLNQKYFGTGVYNDLGQIIGISVRSESLSSALPIEGINYVVDISKALKIANSIKNKGVYQANSFSFDIISLGDLDLRDRKYYGVHKSVKAGAIVLSFDPMKYIFGGINQGMAIIQINNVKVENAIDAYYQINRYQKGDTVNLKLINRSGKIVSYDTQII